jgi:hypothetical protein
VCEIHLENVLREVCPLFRPAEADEVGVAEAVAHGAVVGIAVGAREEVHEGLLQPLLGAKRHEAALVALAVLAGGRLLQRRRQAHGLHRRHLRRPVLHGSMPLRHRIAVLTQVF